MIELIMYLVVGCLIILLFLYLFEYLDECTSLDFLLNTLIWVTGSIFILSGIIGVGRLFFKFLEVAVWPYIL